MLTSYGANVTLKGVEEGVYFTFNAAIDIPLSLMKYKNIDTLLDPREMRVAA